MDFGVLLVPDFNVGCVQQHCYFGFVRLVEAGLIELVQPQRLRLPVGSGHLQESIGFPHSRDVLRHERLEPGV